MSAFEAKLVDPSDQMAEFLLERPTRTATAREISQHFFVVWSAEELWCIARDNPDRFIIEPSDRHLPADLRMIQLVEPTWVDSA
jgi:hypothetical protein